MKKLLLLLSVVLAGCGGGGTVPTTPVMLTASVTPVALFATSPQLLPDLRAKYDLLCGSEVMVQIAIPIDLNKDGKMDLVFILRCNHNIREAYTGPVPNTLVALIQTSPGVFEDKTKEIFGSDIVDIGGISMGYVVTDLNSDGYDDMVMSCNREDNRTYLWTPSDQFSNMRCQTVSFISDGKGHYNKLTFGNILWGDEIKLIKDKNGNKQIVLLPADKSAEVWTFNGQWNSVSGFEWLQKTAVFIQPENSTSPTMIVNKFDNGQKLEIWKNLNDGWSKLLDYSYLAPTTILLKNSAQNTTTTTIFKVDNNDYIDYGGLNEGCALKRTKDGPTEVLYSFIGKLIKGDYTGQQLTDTWSPPVVKLISSGVTTENLNINPITLNTEQLDANFYHMECGDINGDGVDDILIRTTGTPLVYVNNGQGKFGKLNSSIIPKVPRGSAHIYVDIDGDGIKDLLYFPIDRWQFDWRENNTYTKVQFQLFKGNRAIMQDDLIFAN